MSTLVVKNIPDQLHAKLRQQAQRNHRSVTKEVVNLIEVGLDSQRAKSELPLDLTQFIGRWPRYKNMGEVVKYVRELRKDRDED